MPLTTGTYAIFNTTEGKITVRLFPDLAPITVANFVDLAEGNREWTHPLTGVKSKSKLYDGTVFHRVIPNFMVQGGGFTPDMKQTGSQSPFQNEADTALTNS